MEKQEESNTTQQDTTPAQTQTEPEFTVEPDDGSEERRENAIRKMRTRGIIGLIFGALPILNIFIVARILEANSSRPFGGLMAFPAAMTFYGLTTVAIPLTIILLIVNLSEKKRHNLPFTSHIGMSIAGVILALAPYLVAETWERITALL